MNYEEERQRVERLDAEAAREEERQRYAHQMWAQNYCDACRIADCEDYSELAAALTCSQRGGTNER